MHICIYTAVALEGINEVYSCIRKGEEMYVDSLTLIVGVSTMYS